jgi:perosamine synthetase
MDINFFNTYIGKSAYANLKKVLDTTFLSEGRLVKDFEEKLSEELGLLSPVAVNSGTSALHLALVLAGVKPGDEIILPAQTFVATGTIILQEKAVPVFADINYRNGNIDPRSIEEKITGKTKAIIAVHWAGYPCDMDEIHSIARKHGLKVIEDAAHALGASYKNKPIGGLSDFTCFSFQAIKHLTTGDGGAICCLNKNDAKRAFARRWFGIDRDNSRPSLLGEREYDISEAGYKYHMNDLAAALGLANLEAFGQRLARRQLIAERYFEAFKKIPDIKLFEYAGDRKSAYWLYGFHVERRNDFIESLKGRGVPTSVVHLGIDHNSVFGGKDKKLVNQRKFDETQINIPIHDGLSDEVVGYIIDSVKAGW